MTSAKRRMPGICGASVLALAAASPAWAGPSRVRAEFTDSGLVALEVGGRAALADGSVRIRRVRLADAFRDRNAEDHQKQIEVPPGRDPYAGETRAFRDGDAEPDRTSFDHAKRRLALDFEWGSLAVTYRAGAGRLDLEVEIANASRDPVEQVVADLISLRLPRGGARYPASRWTKFAEQRSARVRLEAGRRHYVEALHKEASGGDNLSVAWRGPGIERQVIPGARLSPPGAPDKTGSVLLERWDGVQGAGVADLTSAAAYPDRPTASEELASFDAPVDRGDNYGARVRGFVHPPATGEYVFWIASDDASELWLGTGEDPASKRKVAEVPGWVGVSSGPEIVSSQPGWARDDANVGAPLVLRADHAAGTLVVASARPGGPLRYELAREGEDTVALRVTVGDAEGGRELYDGVWNSRPVKAGATDRFAVSLIFGGDDADPVDLAADAFAAFRARHPFGLAWPDRRPIGAIHLADNRTSERNPRGWRHGSSVPDDWDVREPGAVERFRECLLRGAAGTLDVARRTGMQGVIVWQPEGQQFDCAYYGEPRLVPWIAPEMEAAADDYFRTLREGGLRVGVCIRPPIYTPLDADKKRRVAWKDVAWIAGRDWTRRDGAREGESPYDVYHSLGTIFEAREAQSPLERLDAKIAYAKRRWGATLFYIDTNHFWRPRDRSKEGWAWEGRMLPAEVFEELHRRHPDVLLVPEHEYAQYWTSTAPYLQPPGWGRTTERDVKALYPEAFSVICSAPGADYIQRELSTYARAVADGDIFMFNGWYAGEDVTRFYRVSAATAPYRLRLGAGGRSELERRVGGPGPVPTAGDAAAPEARYEAAGSARSRAELVRVLKRELARKAGVPSRRVWIVHPAGVAPKELVDAVEAVGEAGGIVAWSSPEGE